MEEKKSQIHEEWHISKPQVTKGKGQSTEHRQKSRIKKARKTKAHDMSGGAITGYWRGEHCLLHALHLFLSEPF